jgi:hypothetical protein
MYFLLKTNRLNYYYYYENVVESDFDKDELSMLQCMIENKMAGEELGEEKNRIHPVRNALLVRLDIKYLKA